MEKIIIIGAGGHGRVVLDILRAAKTYEPIGFLDSNPDLAGRKIDGLTILGDVEKLESLANQVDGAIVAIGDASIRRYYAELVESFDVPLLNAIHPSANIAGNAIIGKNVVIAAGALVCAHCQIGNSVILNTGSIVDHESMVANSAHICPGAKLAGRVLVESGAYIGIGATVIQNVRIGTDAVVGAGAVVIRDVPPAVTVVGVPARIIKRKFSEPVRFPPNSLEESLEAVTI
jgi:sugar O-acyltransferase (sialic acid O-acetyltransferase NeuD family)